MAKETEDFKFGVGELADYLGLEDASVRIKLRNAGVKKASTGRYGWKTKDEMKAVGDKLKETKAKPAAKKAEKAEKPAKEKADKKAPAGKSKDKASAKKKAA